VGDAPLTKAWGRLLRLSLAPTAAADVAAGAAIGAGGWPGGSAPFVLMLASLCVYHGGMALNDWADREADRRTRPDRPIPSGAVPPSAALALGVALLLAGPLVALAADRSSACVLAAAAAAAALYDLGPRGALAGPLLLGLCRAANLSAAILLSGSRAVAPALLYGAYVFGVSSLARLEDAPPEARNRARPSVRLAVAALLLAAAPLPVFRTGEFAAWAALALAITGSAGLLAAARRRPPWSGADVTRATGLGLRRLLVFDAALALAGGGAAGPVVAAIVLAGYPVSYLLRGVFPPS
jgi:hypothetical protein